MTMCIKKIISLLLLIFPAICSAQFTVGVPSDVLKDYRAWLGTRDVYTLTRYQGVGARRDLVELALFLQAFDIGCSRRDVSWVLVDSYERLLNSLLSGEILATGTTIWSEPFDEGLVALTQPAIADGRFTALFYALAGKESALKRTRDLRKYRVVSSSQWSRDWQALDRLPVKRRLDVNSWKQMVRWLASGRADLLLAPANSNDGSRLMVDDVQLAPMTGMRMFIPGSRHFAFHIHEFEGAQAGACFSRGLFELERSGRIEQAYQDAGFWNKNMDDWPLVELEPLPKPEPDPDAPVILPW